MNINKLIILLVVSMVWSNDYLLASTDDGLSILTGTGQGDDSNRQDDFAREQVNGHSDAYNSLREMVEYHIHTVNGINNYIHSQTKLPSRADLDMLGFIVMDRSSPHCEDRDTY